VIQPWVIDGHCDSLGGFLSGKRTLKEDTEDGHWNIPRAKQGKIGLQFLAAFIESEFKPAQATLRGLQLIEAAHRLIKENPNELFLIRQKKDLQALPEEKRIGLLLSVEGGEILGESLFLLDIIYELGVRALGLTWNQRNAIADGIGEYGTESRLTRFGVKVVRRMNELGMIVDVSHLNEPGFWHVLEISEQPIIASHSCSYALCPHPRNLTDAQLKALAQNGGLVGVNFFPKFLNPSGRAGIDDVVRHISHIAEIAGIDSVGLGSDFDGIEEVPEGLEHAGKYIVLAEKLDKAGFTTVEISKIFHGNFMRLLSCVLK